MKTTKLLSLVLALVMVFTAFGTLTVSASDGWDGTTKTKPAGSGTEEDPYLIATAENLAWVAYMASCHGGNTTIEDAFEGCYLRQTADIDLNGKTFKSIGVYNGAGSNLSENVYDTDGTTITTAGKRQVFSGTYDGQGFKISNGVIVNYNKGDAATNCNWAIGFFGFTYGATLRNMVLENMTITRTARTDMCGILIGCTLPGKATVIENCKVQGTITAAYEGSSGLVKDGTGVSTSTSVLSSMYGGFIGLSNSDVTFENCIADVAITIDNAHGIGTFIGRGYAKVTMTNCVSKGTLKATASGDALFVGGFCASVNGGGSATNCANYATIEVTGTNCVGGFVSAIPSGYTYTNCANYGKITVTEGCSTSLTLGVGGFTGWGPNGTYVNCANYGDITVSKGADAVAGIHARSNGGGSKFTSCVNKGNLTFTCRAKGGSYFGGIVGDWRKGNGMTDCYNYGNMTVSGAINDESGFGGLIGNIDNVTLKIEITNCANFGYTTFIDTLSKTADVGGLIGRLIPNSNDYTAASPIITNCYNLQTTASTVKTTSGNARIGKIVGSVWGSANTGAYVSVVNCGVSDVEFSVTGKSSYAELTNVGQYQGNNKPKDSTHVKLEATNLTVMDASAVTAKKAELDNNVSAIEKKITTDTVTPFESVSLLGYQKSTTADNAIRLVVGMDYVNRFYRYGLEISKNGGEFTDVGTSSVLYESISGKDGDTTLTYTASDLGKTGVGIFNLVNIPDGSYVAKVYAADDNEVKVYGVTTVSFTCTSGVVTID